MGTKALETIPFMVFRKSMSVSSSSEKSLLRVDNDIGNYMLKIETTNFVNLTP